MQQMTPEKDYYQHHKDDLEEICKALIKGCGVGVMILIFSLAIGMLIASL